LALGIFWFFAAHFLTSNVVPLELMFEHRNYFALFGVLLALADLVRLVPVRDGPAIKYLGVGALVAGFAVFGAIRAAMWSNPLMLAMELAERNPDSPRAALDLGILYYGMADGNPDSPFLDMARRQLEHAAALPRAGILPDANLILLAALRDEPSPQASWDRLQRRLRTTPLTPETMNALTNLLSARRKGRPVDEHQLLAAFDILFSRGPQPAFLYAQVGDFALNFAGDEARALGYFRQAIEHAQSQPELPGQIVANLLQEGRFALAAELAEYARGLGLLPTAPEGSSS
jgi:Flp pilus assembly protein TadD